MPVTSLISLLPTLRLSFLGHSEFPYGVKMRAPFELDSYMDEVRSLVPANYRT